MRKNNNQAGPFLGFLVKYQTFIILVLLAIFLGGMAKPFITHVMLFVLLVVFVISWLQSMRQLKRRTVFSRYDGYHVLNLIIGYALLDAVVWLPLDIKDIYGYLFIVLAAMIIISFVIWLVERKRTAQNKNINP